MKSDSVIISEVGPRDGLQNASTIMPLEGKVAWIEALVQSGFVDIEVGSFVSPTLLPQLADTGLLLEQLRKKTCAAKLAVLVPNLKGATLALAKQPDKISIPFSCSQTHSIKNVNRTHEQMFSEIVAIKNLLDSLPDPKPSFEVGLSTAFGCTIEGDISQSAVLDIATKLISLGIHDMSVADTTGYANPNQVREMMKSLRYYIGAHAASSIHLHNTRGLGLANALAAYEVGVTVFDSSCGGLGGCPFAPGASGNIVTEDLVFMFESMGVATGIDITKLLSLRAILKKYLPMEPLYGFLADAGLPKK
ncbi:MAG: hydroxymethylglutaryl-CoA lyase [Methylacidiphilales bacterium]|nr:hydroxymethylglutaryl-CoA lyase [Candidatus Methylacidiphilales bacterium]